MIPLLIISGEKKLIEDYIDKKVKTDDNLFFEILPLTKEYSIEDIKNLIKETKVFHPKVRVYFLADFHLSSIPAQNSFLKLLEEPPSNVQFVLSTYNKYSLLPTIISRVKIIKLGGENLIKIDQILRKDLEDLIENQNIKILNQSIFSQMKRDVALNLLSQLVIFFRERLAEDKNASAVIKEVIRLKNLLENNNLNPQLTVDQTLIFIWKKYSMK
jgi:DNA polymerase III gamma/tau subunit